jgi:hypothetical protein
MDWFGMLIDLPFFALAAWFGYRSGKRAGVDWSDVEANVEDAYARGWLDARRKIREAAAEHARRISASEEGDK